MKKVNVEMSKNASLCCSYRLTRSEKGLVVLWNSVGSESEASCVFRQGPQLDYVPANNLAPGWAIR